MTIGSEPEPRSAGRRGGPRPRGAGGAGETGDDLLTFLEIATLHFGEAPVADPEHHVDRFGLALGVEHVDASRRAGVTAAPGPGGRPAGRQLVVLRLLRRGQ